MFFKTSETGEQTQHKQLQCSLIPHCLVCATKNTLRGNTFRAESVELLTCLFNPFLCWKHYYRSHWEPWVMVVATWFG